MHVAFPCSGGWGDSEGEARLESELSSYSLSCSLELQKKLLVLLAPQVLELSQFSSSFSFFLVFCLFETQPHCSPGWFLHMGGVAVERKNTCVGACAMVQGEWSEDSLWKSVLPCGF